MSQFSWPRRVTWYTAALLWWILRGGKSLLQGRILIMKINFPYTFSSLRFFCWDEIKNLSSISTRRTSPDWISPEASQESTKGRQSDFEEQSSGVCGRFLKKLLKRFKLRKVISVRDFVVIRKISSLSEKQDCLPAFYDAGWTENPFSGKILRIWIILFWNFQLKAVFNLEAHQAD